MLQQQLHEIDYSLKHVIDDVNRAKLGPVSLDQKYFLNKRQNKLVFQVMAPTKLLTGMRIQMLNLNQSIRANLLSPQPLPLPIRYKLTIQPNPLLPKVLKYLSEETGNNAILNFRSRQISISCPMLQKVERARKLRNIIKAIPIFKKKMSQPIIRRKISEFSHRYINIQESKFFKPDFQTFEHYVKEHSTSSVIPGVKWGQLTYDKQQVSCLFSALMHKRRLLGRFYARYNYNVGIRGRNKSEVTHLSEVVPLLGSITSSRIVLFKAIASISNAFVVDKLSYNKYLLEDLLPKDIQTPLLGVNPWKYARDVKPRMFDGANQEMWTGITFYKDLPGLIPLIDGFPQEASGDDTTTTKNTLTLSWLVKKGLIFSDDAFVDDSSFTEIPGIINFEKRDDFFKFVLGVSTTRWSYLGFKLTHDSPEKLVNTKFTHSLYVPGPKSTEHELINYLSPFFGIDNLAKDTIENIYLRIPDKYLPDMNEGPRTFRRKYLNHEV